MITLEKLKQEKVDFYYLKKFWDSYVWEQRLNTGTRHQMVIEGFNLVGPFEEDLRKKRSILEIGPGRGNMLKAIFTKLGNRNAELHAADISMNILDHIEAPFPIYKHDLLEIPKEIADVAYCHLVLQHTPENLIPQFFKAIKKALVKGGSFYLQYHTPQEIKIYVEPTLETITWEFVIGKGWLYYSEEEVTKWLRDAGFDVLKTAEIPQPKWGYIYCKKIR